MTRLLVHHVSADFPDSIDGDKTKAIARLVELAEPNFAQHVWSLNRRSPELSNFAVKAVISGLRPDCEIETEAFGRGSAIIYRAPPRGIFHACMLTDLGRKLAERIADGPRPDVLVGHKLTVEGLVVHEAARLLDLPFALSIQGDTDTKILGVRPDLRRRFAEAFHDAKVVFPFAPWSLERVEEQLGKRAGKTAILPCATDLDTSIAPRTDGTGLLSVFHLKSHRRKNLHGMVAAMRLLEAEGGAPRLDVIGGGSDTDRAACERVIKRSGRIHFLGAMAGEDVRQCMNRATALVLPSLRESFGIVFIEALFAGCPVIYPKGCAVDGFFDGAAFAIPVDARDPTAIAAAMQRAVAEEIAMKAELAEWQVSSEAVKFTRSVIGASFVAGLQHAIAVRGS